MKAEEALQDLLNKSPFGTAAKPAAPAENAAALEFRGVFIDKGEPFFSLFDPATKSAGWVGLHEPGSPFSVQVYDAQKNEIVVEYQGRKTTLGLKQAKVAVASPATPPAAAEPGIASPASPAPVTAAIQDPEEVKRQAVIAEEIRRRRALRQEANPNGVPLNAPVQQPPPGSSR